MWYQLPGGFLIGLPNAGFHSADYFPLLPWLLLFLTGMYLSKALHRHMLARAEKLEIPFLSWIGRHSLLIYLLHQPVLLAFVGAVVFFTSF